MARPKVYVIQETLYDFSAAEKFGDLVFMSYGVRSRDPQSVAEQDDFNNMKGSERNRRLVAHLRVKLRDFDSDHDYLLIAGSIYVAAAVFMMLGARGIRRVTVLRWSNRDFDYAPLHMEIEQETRNEQAVTAGRGPGW